MLLSAIPTRKHHMPADLPLLPRQRIIAIDALRGLTFFVMLFVNCLAGADGVPYGLQHFAANVDGMSLADIVFPAFLFVVGTSIPFGLNHRLAIAGGMPQTLRLVVARAFGLIVIGFYMVNTEDGYNQAGVIHPCPSAPLRYTNASAISTSTPAVRTTLLKGPHTISTAAYRSSAHSVIGMPIAAWL